LKKDDDSIDEDDALENIFDEDDEDMGGPTHGGMIFPFAKHMLPPQVQYTPWGAFNADNPLSPANMYDLQMAHFRGFTVHTIPNFIQLMDSVEGVAVWTQHDPYCIAVGPAKTYTSEEVKINVEKAIYAALGVPDFSPQPIQQMQSIELMNEGVHNIIVQFPNGNTTVYREPSEEQTMDLLKLKTQVDNVVIFQDGKEIT
jgi:hypothetical protein